jgi:hypothetical protein
MPPTLTVDFPLTEGEDNIVDRLKERINYYGLKVPTVSPLGTMSDDEVVLAIKRGPSIFVVYENDYYEQTTELVGDVFQNGWRVWRVLVVCTSMRGPHEARRGELGAYVLSDAVKAFLVGFDPVTNSPVEQNFPLLLLSRANAPADDLSDYMMLMRFAHPLEASTQE